MKNRREPIGKWSQGRGIIHRGQNTMTLVVAFEDPSQVPAEWERVGCWRKIQNATAVTHTARLEKTGRNEPWLDFGIRVYRGVDSGEEPTDSRTAVPIVVGGNNRPAIISHLRRISCIDLVFAALEPAFCWEPFLSNLARGIVTPADGTEPILLDSLTIFGRRYQTGRQACNTLTERSG
jgi:hypothetical protein